MSNESEKLNAVLTRQRYLLEEIHDLLQVQKKAILYNDLQALSETVDYLNSLLEMMNQVEMERSRELAQLLGMPRRRGQTVTLSALLEKLPENERPALEKLGGEIRRQIERVQEANRLNKFLIQKSRSFIRRNLDWLLHLKSPDVTYDHRKRVKRRPYVRDLVNRTA
jgi:flagellar biosynthesis/type III secretory pathway chaperone